MTTDRDELVANLALARRRLASAWTPMTERIAQAEVTAAEAALAAHDDAGDPFASEGPFVPLEGEALAEYQAMLRGERRG